MPAKHRQAHDHAISRLDVAYLRANGLHRAGGFVSQDRRHVHAILALNEMQIAVADTRCPGSDQHLSGAGVVYLNVFDGKGSVNRV
jgi:hypothetical protein